MSQLTVAEAKSALNQEIVLASTARAAVGSKKLTYNVGDKGYTIYSGAKKLTETGSLDTAVDYYNEAQLG